MAVTLKEIARECSVSVYAVSRVLNDKKIYLVQEKRERILKTAKKFNYVPNIAAKSLQTKRSQVIGLIVSHQGQFVSELVEKLSAELSRRDYSLHIAHSINSFDKEQKLVGTMRQHKTDALLVMSAYNQTRDIKKLPAYLKLIKSLDNVLFIDAFVPGKNINFVTSDNYNAAYSAVRHFIEKGCKNIYYISKNQNPSLPVLDERYKGAKQVCEEYRVPFVELLMADFRKQDEVKAVNLIRNLQTKSLFFFQSLNNEFDNFLGAVKKCGKTAGTDFYVCGFDKPVLDDPFALVAEFKNVLSGPLSYIEQDAAGIIQKSISFLEPVLNGGTAVQAVERVSPLLRNF